MGNTYLDKYKVKLNSKEYMYLHNLLLNSVMSKELEVFRKNDDKCTYTALIYSVLSVVFKKKLKDVLPKKSITLELGEVIALHQCLQLDPNVVPSILEKLDLILVSINYY